MPISLSSSMSVAELSAVAEMNVLHSSELQGGHFQPAYKMRRCYITAKQNTHCCVSVLCMARPQKGRAFFGEAIPPPKVCLSLLRITAQKKKKKKQRLIYVIWTLWFPLALGIANAVTFQVSSTTETKRPCVLTTLSQRLDQNSDWRIRLIMGSSHSDLCRQGCDPMRLLLCKDQIQKELYIGFCSSGCLDSEGRGLQAPGWFLQG